MTDDLFDGGEQLDEAHELPTWTWAGAESALKGVGKRVYIDHYAQGPGHGPGHLGTAGELLGRPEAKPSVARRPDVARLSK